jgi:hypothetical protein
MKWHWKRDRPKQLGLSGGNEFGVSDGVFFEDMGGWDAGLVRVGWSAWVGPHGLVRVGWSAWVASLNPPYVGI